MFLIPPTGNTSSVLQHNGKLDVEADWIEASAAFQQETVSHNEIVDALIENGRYRDQGFANIWVDDLFKELERRFRLLGDAGTLSRNGNLIKRKHDWKKRPGYAFCLALAMVPHYRSKVEKAFGRNYGRHGSLFENLCTESLKAQHWSATGVGWSKTATNKLDSKVGALAAVLGEPALNAGVSRWGNEHAKDAGLDIVAWKNYPDGWSGRPLCFVQCASGADWREKLHTPDIATWKKFIDFATSPSRGLAMPFAPEADDFRKHSNKDFLAFLLDRHRILLPANKEGSNFPSPELSAKLIKWLKPVIDAFPSDSE